MLFKFVKMNNMNIWTLADTSRIFIIILMAFLFWSCQTAESVVDYKRLEQKIKTGKPVNINDLLCQYYRVYKKWPENTEMIKMFCKAGNVRYNDFFKGLSGIKMKTDGSGDFILTCKSHIGDEFETVDTIMHFKIECALQAYSLIDFSKKWKTSIKGQREVLPFDVLYKALIGENENTVLAVLGLPDSCEEDDGQDRKSYYYQLDHMWTLIIIFNKNDFVETVYFDD